MFEKTGFVQLNSYLGENDVHEPLQSAYKTFHSTETALLTVTNDIVLSLDKGENVFLVLLDLSAAFDTVSHSLLPARLQKSFRIRGTVLQWFDSYLSQRTQPTETAFQSLYFSCCNYFEVLLPFMFIFETENMIKLPFHNTDQINHPISFLFKELIISSILYATWKEQTQV